MAAETQDFDPKKLLRKNISLKNLIKIIRFLELDLPERKEALDIREILEEKSREWDSERIELKERIMGILDQAESPAKKVLMMTPFYEDGGGVAGVVRELTEALERKGHQVDIAVHWMYESFRLRKDGEWRGYKPDEHERFINDLEGYDVVHLHSHCFSDFYDGGLETILNKLDAPSLLWCHCIVPRQVETGVAGLTPAKVRETKAQKQTMNLVDRVVHLTGEGRELAEHYYPEFRDKFEVIPNGTNKPPVLAESRLDALKKRLAPNGEKIILYLGRISKEKGIDEMALAFPKLKERHPDAKLVITGNEYAETGDIARMKKYMQDLEEGKDYVFTGWLEGETLEKYRQVADLVLLPSYYEHFPLAALESMIRKKPVVITDTPGPSGVFRLKEGEDERMAVPIQRTHNVDDIVDAVDYAFSNPGKVASMVDRAHKEVEENYLWDNVAEKVTDLYDNIERKDHRRPVASFVIPTYNRKELLVEAIDSALDQDFDERYEIIVVDDGSSDSTIPLLKRTYQRKIKYIKDEKTGHIVWQGGKRGKIKIIRKENSGVSSARNAGYREAVLSGSEFITHIDDDDRATPNRLRDLVSYMRSNPDVGLAHARSRDISFEGKPLGKRNFSERYFESARGPDPDSNTLKYLQKVNYIHGGTTMVRSTALQKLSRDDICGLTQLFWEEISYGEDWDFWQKMMRTAKVGFVDSIVHEYRDHPGRATRQAGKSDGEEDEIILGDYDQRFKDTFDKIVLLGTEADFHANMGDHDTATRLYQRLLNIHPEHPAALDYMRKRKTALYQAGAGLSFKNNPL